MIEKYEAIEIYLIYKKLTLRTSHIKAKLFIKKLLFKYDLKNIAETIGGDKMFGHNYVPLYEKHFQKIRKKELRVLEIGIGGYKDPNSGGESLLMWSHYFKNSKIIGADIFEKNLDLPNNVQVVKLDQSIDSEIEQLGNKHGPFDIVIDDGSHVSKHVISTFQILFKFLNQDGIYVVEDTQTSYWEKFGGYEKDDPRRATSFFKNLTDGLNHMEFLVKNYKPSYFEQNVKSIHFYHNIIFLEKKYNNQNSLFVKDGKLNL